MAVSLRVLLTKVSLGLWMPSRIISQLTVKCFADCIAVGWQEKGGAPSNCDFYSAVPNEIHERDATGERGLTKIAWMGGCDEGNKAGQSCVHRLTWF